MYKSPIQKENQKFDWWFSFKGLLIVFAIFFVLIIAYNIHPLLIVPIMIFIPFIAYGADKQNGWKKP